MLGPVEKKLIGLLIAMSSVPSIMAAMAQPRLLQLFGARCLIFTGLVAYGGGSFFLGSWELLEPWSSQVTGLLLIGLGWGLCWTPLLPCMVDHAATKLGSPEARHLVAPSISALFSASAALGEAFGPLLGTWLLPKAFQVGAKAMAIFLVLYATCTLLSDKKARPLEPCIDP